MRLVAAELVDSREILPRQWLQAYHAPALASGSRAGQFVHVRPGDYSGLILRRPFSFNTVDPQTGIVTIHFRTVGRGTRWFTHLRPGDTVDMLGPLGRPFEVDPRSRHLLLIAGGLGIAGVRMLADEAIRDGRQVVLLFGAASAAEVYPSNLLPDEVEYVVATDDGSLGHQGYVTDLVPDYEAWADQAFACGPSPHAGRPRATGRRPPRAARRREARPEARRREAGSARLTRGAAQGVPPGVDGAEHGLRGGGLPRLRRHGRRRSAPAGLPRGTGLRRRGARLGGRLVKAKRRVVTSGNAGPVKASKASRSIPGSGPKRPASVRPGGGFGGGLGSGRRLGAGKPAVVGQAGRSATSTRIEPIEPAVSSAPRPVDLSVDLGRGLRLPNPILVASGTFGYGVEYGDVVDVDRLGAICCKGTTLRPRIGNPTPRVTETPAGMLNSIGLQNPGVDAVIEKYASTWQGWQVPVIVNVAGESVADYVEVARRLDGVPGVAGIELNISCPNVGRGGLQFAIDAGAAGEVTAAVRRATDLPLLVKLSPNVADIRPIARAIAERGRRRDHRDQHALGDRRPAGPDAAAPRQRLRWPVRPGDQAGGAADRVRGRPGRRHPDRRDRRRGGARRTCSTSWPSARWPCRSARRIFADPTLPVRLVDELAGECRRHGLDSYRPLIGTALPRRPGAPSVKGVEYRP